MSVERGRERQRRRDAVLSHAVDLALFEHVDAVLISGDLFDGHDPSLEVLEPCLAQLRRLTDAGIALITVPGTFDEISYPTCVYRTLAGRWPGALAVSPKPEPLTTLELEGGRVHFYGGAFLGGAPATLSAFPRLEGEGLHVGVFHGRLLEDGNRQGDAADSTRGEADEAGAGAADEAGAGAGAADEAGAGAGAADEAGAGAGAAGEAVAADLEGMVAADLEGMVAAEADPTVGADRTDRRGFILDPKGLAAAGYHYVALGGVHRRQVFRFGETVAAYPGLVESLGFDEPGAACFVLVRLEAGQPAQVEVMSFPAVAQPMLGQVLDVSGADVGEVAAKIRQMSNPEALVRVTLEGTPTGPLDAKALAADLADGFFHLEIVDATERLDDASLSMWASELTILGQFVRRMRLRLQGAASERERRVLERALHRGVEALHAEVGR